MSISKKFTETGRAYLLVTAILLFILSNILIADNGDGNSEDLPKTPNDWFIAQRSFPHHSVNYAARNEAFFQYKEKKEDALMAGRNLGWMFEGPVNIGGRISALAMHDNDDQTIYAGAASGGVFKSTDAGTSWTPVFDDALSLSIGDIAIAPSDPDILYVGTGEANGGGGSLNYDGFGIYRSDDAGATWDHLGLEQSGSIGRLAVHPSDPDRVYVAAMGRLFSKNPERGIFRSSDGGDTWEKVLYISDSTGAIDVVIHPNDPDTVYACLWERVREPHRRSYGGHTSGIYRSTDGGDTWTELMNGLPNGENVGRIGIDIAASDPDILYSIYADKIGYFSGVYKTTDHGDTWTRTNDGALSNMYSSYGWWFGRISVDPTDPDVVFGIGFDLYKTTTGGNSWFNTSGPVHVDQHDLVAHPTNSSNVFLGNDGGVYISDDGGSSWTHLQNMPITQFYTCEVDEQYPYRFYGGTQDNGTNRTLTGSINDWHKIYGGDGFYVLVDPLNNSYVYAEYQYGNMVRSTNGGTSFYSAMSGISSSDRKNWNTPIVFDPSDPSILYYGANRLYKSINRAQSWTPVSDDLTNGPGTGNLVYGTITTIAVAESNNEFIYAGTDDGNVWVTDNGGSDWEHISQSLPERWVTRLAVDPYDENIAYVTLSGYRNDSYQPHIFRTENAGQVWTDISGDLPEAPVNDVIVDPQLDSTLYIATDFGVYVSRDLGIHWKMVGTNLPNVPVVDLDYHHGNRMLVAATYGRSMYTFALDQLVDISEYNLEPRNNILILAGNPVQNTLRFKLASIEAGPVEFEIADLKGSVLMRGTDHGSRTISVNELPEGMYVLRVSFGMNAYAIKFLKSR